jgi:hypothetical protein
MIGMESGCGEIISKHIATAIEAEAQMKGEADVTERKARRPRCKK